MALDLTPGIDNLASAATTSEQVGAIIVGVKHLIVAYWPLVVVPLAVFLIALVAQAIISASGEAIAGPVPSHVDES